MQTQMVKCRCGSDQWSNVNYCGACGGPIAALAHPILSAAHRPDPVPWSTPPPTVRTIGAGRSWRVAGFLACSVGMVLAVTGAGPVGGVLLFGGFVAFVVGRLME